MASSDSRHSPLAANFLQFQFGSEMNRRENRFDAVMNGLPVCSCENETKVTELDQSSQFCTCTRQKVPAVLVLAPAVRS